MTVAVAICGCTGAFTEAENGSADDDGTAGSGDGADTGDSEDGDDTAANEERLAEVVETFYRSLNDGDLGAAREHLHSEAVVGDSIHPIEETDFERIDATTVETDLRGERLESRLGEVKDIIFSDATEPDEDVFGIFNDVVDGEDVAEITTHLVTTDPSGETGEVTIPWLLVTEDDEGTLFAPIVTEAEGYGE